VFLKNKKKREKKKKGGKKRCSITERIISIDPLQIRRGMLLRISRTFLIQLPSVSTSALQTCFAAVGHPSTCS